MSGIKKIVIGATVAAVLSFGAFVGTTGDNPAGGLFHVAVAHADDGCDASPPPVGLDCPPNPTPTPTPDPEGGH